MQQQTLDRENKKERVNLNCIRKPKVTGMWVLPPVPPSINCVMLVKLLHIEESWFPHLQNKQAWPITFSVPSSIQIKWSHYSKSTLIRRWAGIRNYPIIWRALHVSDLILFNHLINDWIENTKGILVKIKDDGKLWGKAITAEATCLKILKFRNNEPSITRQKNVTDSQTACEGLKIHP